MTVYGYERRAGIMRMEMREHPLFIVARTFCSLRFFREKQQSPNTRRRASRAPLPRPRSSFSFCGRSIPSHRIAPFDLRSRVKPLIHAPRVAPASVSPAAFDSFSPRPPPRVPVLNRARDGERVLGRPVGRLDRRRRVCSRGPARGHHPDPHAGHALGARRGRGARERRFAGCSPRGARGRCGAASRR